MKKIVSAVSDAAVGRWEEILPSIGINISLHNIHCPCPTCGGIDRFRFDNKGGRGSWFCNQCTPQAGDGLDLVANVHHCSIKEAAEMVAPIVGITPYNIQYGQQENNQSQAKSKTDQILKKQQDNEHKKTQKARDIWQRSIDQQSLNSNNTYLHLKGVGAYGVRFTTDVLKVAHHTFALGALIIPRIDQAGDIQGIQVIDTDEKRHIGPVKGSYHLIGNPSKGKPLFIVEGYADGATIFELIGHPVVVAFSANELTAVSTCVLKLFPKTQLYFPADKDQHGLGEKMAKKAAQSSGGFVLTPPFNSSEYGDWNDYVAIHGKKETKLILAKMIAETEKNAKMDPTSTKTAIDTVFSAPEDGTGKNTTETKTDIRNHSAPIEEQMQPMNAIAGWQLADPEADIPRLLRLNKDYGHSTVGNKHVVISLKPCPVNGLTQSFESLSEFKNYFLHEKPVILKTQSGKKAKNMSLGEAWLRWPHKSYHPDGIGFYPRPEKTPPGVYNLFTGTSVSAEEGDCTPWLAHLRDVICAGDEAITLYVLQWLAHIFQKPDEKPSIAIVLKSVEGTGKGTLIEPILRILGPHGININGSAQLTGRFNTSITNKLLLFADEVDLTEKSTADRLKGIISEPTINLERKGIDPEPIPNYARIFFASNHDRVIRAGSRERRYLILEPDETKAQESNYFDNLWKWIDNSGPSYLLYMLQNLSLEGFDPRRCPATPALIREKLESLSAIDQFFYEQLFTPTPLGNTELVYAADLVDRYLQWCNDHDIKITPPQARSRIGKRMSRMGLKSEGRSDRGPGVYYPLPEANELQIRFATMLGSSAKEIF